VTAAEPEPDCALCPRLLDFRVANRAAHTDFHNAPVRSFGALDARLLVVGLAPGLKGANATGRPFTGDYAGDLLYATLLSLGLAAGAYDKRPDDGLSLRGLRITNAVRCVPPANKPLPAEIKTCNAFLKAEIGAMPRLAALLALGQVAHRAVVTALGLRQAAFPFGHCASHRLSAQLTLVDSYHCSRYNTNTGKLTESMFAEAVSRAASAAKLP